jgi:PIN domain
MFKPREKAKEAIPPILLVDTCVWLDLAKDYRQKSLLQAMETLVKRETILLAVPQTVIAELTRNKDRIIKESSRSLSTALKRARETIDQFGNRRRKRSALNELDEIDRKVINLSDAAADIVNRVEALLKTADVIEITDAIKVLAANRGLEKKAPFHRQRNSMGEAMIFECYCDVAARAKSTLRTAFVKHNTNDFSHPTQDNRLEADHFAHKLEDGRPHRGLSGRARSRPLEGSAAFLTCN